jgi:hypothetical protein
VTSCVRPLVILGLTRSVPVNSWLSSTFREEVTDTVNLDRCISVLFFSVRRLEEDGARSPPSKVASQKKTGNQGR